MKGNDVALIQRTLDGDERAFTVLVKKYQKWVHTLVWRKIGDFHIAEELTQDIFLKVYKKLSTLKPPDHFPGWLYVIATRHCIAWLRKKQLPTTSLDAMPAVELEALCYAKYEMARGEEASIEQQRECVKRLLQKLPESERTVVTLYYLAEMTSEEISRFLGVSPNTIRSRLRRARARLEKQEHLLHDVSGVFQVPPTLTENIMREIANIKPTSPSASKPWLPWGLSFTSTLLVILMIGFGPRALSRFQQPYNLDATSEMTIEFVDTPVVLELERKPDALTRFGNTDIPGRNGRSGFQAESLLIAAAQAEETDLPIAKPQWVQTKGPGGVSRAGLFLASDRTLYATAKTGVYRLTEAADTWTLVSTSGPHREFNAAWNTVMAEYGDTLYLLTANELLASIDKGKTWNSLGARPEGRVVTLIITDTAMYLVLRTGVFRSKDVGSQWESIGQTLKIDHIWDALAIDNTLFVGTSHGLFQFTDAWEKLPVPTSHGIKSLAVAGDRLYVGTNVRRQPGAGRDLYAAVFYSTDLGDSWIDITPGLKHLGAIIAAVEVVPVEGTLMLVGVSGVLVSYDRGKTWMDPRPKRGRAVLGAFPVVAVDENNFYITNPSGITRSTDGGATWHPFMAGMVNSHVPHLITVKNVLYALTPTEMFKSADGGESWKSVSLNANGTLETRGAKVATASGVLYASNSELDGVTLFHFSDAGDAFLPVEGVPDFEEGTLHEERVKEFMEAIKNDVDIDKVLEQFEGVPDFEEGTLHEERVKEFMEAIKNDVDIDKVLEQWQADQPRVLEEWSANGIFTVTDDTVFMEYRRKLFRWRRGETAWHDTGLEDLEGMPIGKGFTLAASRNTVYAGKREGDLFLSKDGGDTWHNITANLVFPFRYFKEIVFAGPTVYVSTDMGVMHSRDGETWDVVADAEGNGLIIDRIAVDGATAYGVADSGVYQVDHQTNTWKQIIPELPHTAISFAVDGDTFYIGTKPNGVLRFQRDGR